MNAAADAFDLNKSPFVELDPFTEDHRLFFRGRNLEIENIAANASVSSFTVLYGPTGVGKSSILQAGVVPFLRDDDDRVVVYFRDWLATGYSDTLLKQCLEAVTAAPPEAVASPAAPARTGAPRSRDPFVAAMLEATTALRRPLLLVLDQFDDYLISGAASREFDSRLATLVNRADARVNVLVGIREDYLSRLDRFRTRIPGVLSNTLRLAPLTSEQARDALVEPIEIYNEAAKRQGAADRWLVDISEAAGDDPIAAIIEHAKDGTSIQAAAIQLAMSRLWKRETDQWMESGSNRRRQLRQSVLGELGGVQGILLDYLSSQLKSLADPQIPIVAEIFRHAVAPSGEKRPVYLTDLRSHQLPAIQEVLTTLEETKVLRHPRGTQWYELYHQVLSAGVLTWVAEFDRTNAERLAETERAAIAEERRRATQRAEQERDTLEQARKKAEREAVEQRERAALQQKLAEANAAKLQVEQESLVTERRYRRLATLVAAACVLLAVITVGFSFLGRQLSRKLTELSNEDTARTWAAAATKELNREPALGVVYAGRALSIRNADGHALPAAQIALMQAVRSSHLSYGIDTAASLVAADPRGRYLVTVSAPAGSSRSNARSFTPDGRQDVEIRNHQWFDDPPIVFSVDGPIHRVLFTPDGAATLLVYESGAVDRIGIPDFTLARIVGAMGRPDEPRRVTHAALTSDGKRLVMVAFGIPTSYDMNARAPIWLATVDLGAKQWSSTRLLPDQENQVTLSEAGDRYAAVTADGRVVVRGVASEQAIAGPPGIDSAGSVQLSADGRFALVLAPPAPPTSPGSRAPIADPILWDINGQRHCPLRVASPYPIVDTPFSPDGQYVAIVQRGDRTSAVQAWRTTCEPVDTPMLAQGVRFSANSAHMLVWTDEHVAELRPLGQFERTRLVGHVDDIVGAIVPTRGPIVTWSQSRVNVWSSEPHELSIPTGFETGELQVLAISANGALAATAGRNRSVRIYETRWGALVDDVPVGADVTALAFSHNGRALAVGLADGTVHTLTAERRLHTIAVASGPRERWPISQLAFSTDDTIVAYVVHVDNNANIVVARRSDSNQVVGARVLPARVTSLRLTDDSRAFAVGLFASVSEERLQGDATGSAPSVRDGTVALKTGSWPELLPLTVDPNWERTIDAIVERREREKEASLLYTIDTRRAPASVKTDERPEDSFKYSAFAGTASVAVTTLGNSRIAVWPQSDIPTSRSEPGNADTERRQQDDLRLRLNKSDEAERKGIVFDEQVRVLSVTRDGRYFAAGGEYGLLEFFVNEPGFRNHMTLQRGEARIGDGSRRIAALSFSESARPEDSGAFLASLRNDGVVTIYYLDQERMRHAAQFGELRRPLREGECITQFDTSGSPKERKGVCAPTLTRNRALEGVLQQTVPWPLRWLNPFLLWMFS